MVNHLGKVFFYSRNFLRLKVCCQIDLRHRPAKSADAEAAQGRAGHHVREGSCRFPQQAIHRLKTGDRAGASGPSVCCLLKSSFFLEVTVDLHVVVENDAEKSCRPSFPSGDVLQNYSETTLWHQDTNMSFYSHSLVSPTPNLLFLSSEVVFILLLYFMCSFMSKGE